MKDATIVVGPMTINVDAMTAEELGSLVKALVEVLPEAYAVRLVNEWREKRGLGREELE
jgi:hypothetical protein